MSLILQNLYLGSVQVSRDQNFIQDQQIKYILIAAKGLSMHFPDQITYYRIEIKDDPITIIIKHFVDCCKFIDKARSEQKAVLVHCMGGQSRSASVVTSYVMFKLQISEIQAIQFIKEQHMVAEPNPGFQSQLQLFQQCLNLYYDIIGKMDKKQEKKEPEGEFSTPHDFQLLAKINEEFIAVAQANVQNQIPRQNNADFVIVEQKNGQIVQQEITNQLDPEEDQVQEIIIQKNKEENNFQKQLETLQLSEEKKSQNIFKPNQQQQLEPNNQINTLLPIEQTNITPVQKVIQANNIKKIDDQKNNEAMAPQQNLVKQ